jgi:hypothetical protein
MGKEGSVVAELALEEVVNHPLCIVKDEPPLSKDPLPSSLKEAEKMRLEDAGVVQESRVGVPKYELENLNVLPVGARARYGHHALEELLVRVAVEDGGGKDVGEDELLFR